MCKSGLFKEIVDISVPHFLLYQIKAYHLSCSETLVFVAASCGDLRKQRVSMVTLVLKNYQIYGITEITNVFLL